jgi:hypothetical protein
MDSDSHFYMECVYRTFLANVVTNIMAILLGVLIGILELPSCCTCFPICQKIQAYLVLFEVYWRRAVLYIGIGVLLIVLASQSAPLGGILAYLYGALNVVDGLCYLLAHVRGNGPISPSASCFFPGLISPTHAYH